MQLSAAGLDLIKRSEGFRPDTYLDVAGIATIGYGHRILASENFPNGIDEAHAARILANDVHGADFCFNLGSGKLAASTLLKELNAGQYDAAHQQLLRWDHVGSQEIAGLKGRREAEFQLWGSEPATSISLTASRSSRLR